MTKKQTAVEWLESELDWLSNYMMDEHKEQLFNQAKEMETKQLSKSYHKGVRHEWEGAGGNFQDYYEETYGSNTSI